MQKFIFLICFFVSQVVIATNLSPVETQIRDEVIKNKASQISLLEKLVNINSGTLNIAGVNRVGKIVENQLQQLGFKTHWANEPASMHRAGTLIAEHSGKKGKRLLLIGHLDTVFAPTQKVQQFVINKNSATGPGVVDDKGGVVVILSALNALKAAHVLDDTQITVVLTGDEEDSGKPSKISRKPLMDAAKDRDIALDFEPAITLSTATIARRGITNWMIEVQGNESHSATIFQKAVGDGAIFEIARILNRMRVRLEGEKYLSFNPGFIMGGTRISDNAQTSQGIVFGKQNVVAKIAIAKGDFRFIDTKQKAWFEAQMKDMLTFHLPGTRSKITFEDGIPAMSPSENNLKLLETYSEVSLDLGRGAIKPLDPGIRGAGDISHVSSIVPANLSGLGPTGWGTHSVKESIELNSLPIQTERAAILIYRLTR